MNQAQVAHDWSERGFSCELWVDPPGQVWADFVHEVDELVMLVEGAIELEFGGVTRRPQIGEELLIPAHTAHTVRNIGGVTARWLYGYQRRYRPGPSQSPAPGRSGTGLPFISGRKSDK